MGQANGGDAVVLLLCCDAMVLLSIAAGLVVPAHTVLVVML